MSKEMKVKYEGIGKMFLHKEIGEGQMPDGRRCRLIQTNQGIHMQVYSKKDKNEWKTFSINYLDLGEAIVKEIQKIEMKEEK